MTSDAMPVLICELANSHGGDVSVLERLVDVFGQLDYPRKALKFQVFAADTIALKDYEWYEVYRRLEVSAEDWRRLIEKASAHGEVYIDLFDSYGVEIVAQNSDLIAGIKLQASVLENHEVLSALHGLELAQKILVLNVSGYELDQVRIVIDRFRTITESVVLQTGFQSYPTSIEDTALQKLSALRSSFPTMALGLSDHADGGSDFAELVPLYAALLGCDYLEKHLCLERAAAPYDGNSALEPDQMQRLCSRLKELARANSGPFINPREREYLLKTVQIPVVGASIDAGSRIHPEHLVFRRTALNGIAWSEIDELQRNRFLLKRAKAPLQAVTQDDFRPARVGVVVAARMKSSRLKRKALLPIAGRASVERCLDQCLAVRGVDEVVLATSYLEEDSVLANYLSENRASYWAGDPEDVIARYLGACDEYGVDVVVRVTADCPLVSPEILEALLASHFREGADYTAAAEAAVGTAGEVINTAALREVLRRTGTAAYSEYMTWYFRNNPDVFRLNIVDLPAEYVRDYRLTLDHPEDLELFEEIYRRLPQGQSHYTLRAIYDVLDKTPSLATINSHLPLKYRTDQALIATLNANTRLVR